MSEDEAMRSGLTFFWACAVSLALSAVSAAQDRVTTDDYARAARFMPSATAPLVPATPTAAASAEANP